MKVAGNTFNSTVTVVAVLILLAALPSAVRDTFETGRVYLFSRQFIEELPDRFTGPGRLRFIVQPLMAILIGCRGGLSDARRGGPAYVYGLLTDRENRRELLRSGMAAIRNLVAIGVILDAVAQLLIYRQVHPGAALVLGPVLISVPYALSRAVTNRLVRLMRRASAR